MDNSIKTTVGGTSFCNLLFLAFLVLKLTHVIDWSWWWVTAPLWLPLAIVLGCGLIALGCAIIWAGLANRDHRWDRD